MSGEKFEYKSVDAVQMAYIAQVREGAKEFYEKLISVCPNCEEKLEAVKKLEECAFWANKAISHGNK